MEAASTTPEITSQMNQLNLQRNGSAAPPPPRTGIPRYAIPYRRPGGSSAGVSGERHSPNSSVTSENSINTPEPTPNSRGRNGIRTESLGEEEVQPFYGGGCRKTPGYTRAASVDPLRGDSESENSSVFSASGQPRRITSRIGSLANAKYTPKGGNVKIFDSKVDFSHAQSKCNSKVNLKHKPGGGDIQIVDQKVAFKESSTARVNSLANAKHVAGGGGVKIFNEKLPWLKYNKPNLPPQEKAKINKQATSSRDSTAEPLYTSRHSSNGS